MIGLDTNVLVRYLAQDDPVQSPKANRLFEEELSPDNPGYASAVTMAETVWVLERAYRVKPAALAQILERLLQAEMLAVEAEQEVFTAMLAVKQGRGSFCDAFIAALGTRAGCRWTLTFDRRAAKLAGFRLFS